MLGKLRLALFGSVLLFRIFIQLTSAEISPTGKHIDDQQLLISAQVIEINICGVP